MREEYRVYYENYEELAQEEPGAEIPLQKDIVWENKNSQSERWKALSVFACSQGLVLELAKQVASKQYLAFYEKWKEAIEMGRLWTYSCRSYVCSSSCTCK